MSAYVQPLLKDDKITDVHVSIADGKIIEEGPLQRHHAANTKSMPTKTEQPASKSRPASVGSPVPKRDRARFGSRRSPSGRPASPSPL